MANGIIIDANEEYAELRFNTYKLTVTGNVGMTKSFTVESSYSEYFPKNNPVTFYANNSLCMFAFYPNGDFYYTTNGHGSAVSLTNWNPNGKVLYRRNI